MTDQLLHVEHGSRLARAWLAASLAASNDKERPSLYRTTLVEIFSTGVRLSATDSYWTAAAWVGDPDPDSEYDYPFPAPSRAELPDRVVPVVDLDHRIRDLMAYVKVRTKKVDAEHPDVPLTVSITLDRDDETPTLDPFFDLDRVDVQIPAFEMVCGHVNEIDYPNVARLHWQHDMADTEDVERVQLAPFLLRSLAGACAAVDSSGISLGFHGDPTKPISWTACQPASAPLGGLVMPQRPESSEAIGS